MICTKNRERPQKTVLMSTNSARTVIRIQANRKTTVSKTKIYNNNLKEMKMRQ